MQKEANNCSLLSFLVQLFPYPFCPTSTMDMNQPRLIKRRTSKNADPGAILI